MARDLANTPVSGINVQICGDAHLSNFGFFAMPERNLVFDVNDFDETLPGPWEWDLKRLAASIVVAGRQNGYTVQENRQAVVGCVEEYRRLMRQMASMGALEVWYQHLDTPTQIKDQRAVYPPDRSARSIDAVSSHTSGVFSVHLNGNPARLTQHETGQAMRDVESQMLSLSRKPGTLEIGLYLRYSNPCHAGSTA